MILHDEKRQRRLHRLANQILHAKRLRIPKFRMPSIPDVRFVSDHKVSWWQRLTRFFKSFFDAKPRSTI